MPPRNEEFTESRLIICEGPDDECFFRALIGDRNIKGLQVLRHAEGNTKFREKLIEIEIQVTLHQPKAILIVSDHDDAQDKSFSDVIKQIKKTNLYGVPVTRKVPAKKANRPDITVLMVPENGNGSIETIISDVLVNAPAYAHLSACLDAYKNCAGITDANGWGSSKQAKMMLRSLLAVIDKKSPECKVADMWQSDKGFQPLLSNAGFDTIATFLQEFAIT